MPTLKESTARVLDQIAAIRMLDGDAGDTYAQNAEPWLQRIRRMEEAADIPTADQADWFKLRR